MAAPIVTDRVDLIVRGGMVVTMDAQRRIIPDGAIAIKDGRIADLGDSGEIGGRHSATEVLDLADEVILPGLINAHTHILQILLRGGIGGNRALYDWLINVLTPGLAQYTPDDAAAATRLYCLEAIRSGITTVVENADSGQDHGLAQATLAGLGNSGLRAVYARLFYDTIPEDFGRMVASLADTTHDDNGLAPLESGTEALASIEALIEEFDGAANGRIRVWPAPAMPQTTTEATMIGAFELAAKHDVMVGLHVAQAKVDRQVRGQSAIQYLNSLGVLGPRLQAAHCVWLSDEDVDLLAGTDSRVAHNPVSNLYLCAGIAPTASMLSCGISVGLGTDDANSNNVVNLFQEMKVAVLAHRGRSLEPVGVTPADALEMATIGGARSIGLGSQIGSLEPGKRADLIGLRLDRPQTTPWHDLPATLVFQASGSEVSTSVVDGRVLMRNRQVDQTAGGEDPEILSEAQVRSTEIAARAGLRAKTPDQPKERRQP